ncbi:hypothetical protein PTSG_05379 [Salpingoeca rosetta]|uniref:Uncharacterized protein n=1 Tax=Salpingoeca rosetta (strain ATCC 50818 / BSB-021) TaxID=946362 RepID=F2UA91_SALR5|nr:uncharacterized protein PTSG_05379 [Salpingoeca rosetta]EGD73666.1 hypothetical protein PTSG_05379 [Salpingoeca rosetta]|eukprot:XP_004993947.1 hypothetical protein PTSG_05379 [Salpingoeca rosetta]
MNDMAHQAHHQAHHQARACALRVAEALAQLGYGANTSGRSGLGEEHITAQHVFDEAETHWDSLLRWIFNAAGLSVDSASDYVDTCVLLGLCSREAATKSLPSFDGFKASPTSSTLMQRMQFLDDLTAIAVVLREDTNDVSDTWQQDAALLEQLSREEDLDRLFPETCQLFPADFPMDDSQTAQEALRALKRENDSLETQLAEIQQQLTAIHAGRRHKMIDDSALHTKLRQLDVSLRTLSQVAENFQFTYSDYISTRPNRVPENTDLVSSLDTVSTAALALSNSLSSLVHVPEALDASALHESDTSQLLQVLASCKTATANLLAASAITNTASGTSHPSTPSRHAPANDLFM